MRLVHDKRGAFNKLWRVSEDRHLGIAELFWSSSRRGVIRGMHVQMRPNAGRKVLWVSEGSIIDAVLDLRPESATFAQWTVTELSQGEGALTVPEQCAHGFLSISETATVHYAQEHPYRPDIEVGVLWDSFGLRWPVDHPILSERDRKFPSFHDFIQANGLMAGLHSSSTTHEAGLP